MFFFVFVFFFFYNSNTCLNEKTERKNSSQGNLGNTVPQHQRSPLSLIEVKWAIPQNHDFEKMRFKLSTLKKSAKFLQNKDIFYSLATFVVSL